MKRVVLSLLIGVTMISAHAQKYEVDTVKFVGSGNKYFNVVFLGDGYTSSELNTFVEDVKKSTDGLFGLEPWKQYQNYFNVFLIKTPSPVSGAGLTPQTAVNNFYGTTFGYYGTDRLLYPSSMTKVNKVLKDNLPNYDVVAMIVNSVKYGGAGGSTLLTFSKHNSSKEIFYHEIGHTFAYLADEYWAGEGYATDEKPNMTSNSNSTTVKWKKWNGTNDIGVYLHQESASLKKQWYRPHQNCIMRYLGKPYCAVCRQALVEKIHDKIDPIVSYSPASSGTVAMGSDKVSFELQLVTPNPNTLHTEWLLDGVKVGGNQQAVLEIDPATLSNGSHRLTVAVEDTTEMVRVDNHGTSHVSNVTWNIEKDGSSGISLATTTSRYEIFPVPFDTQLSIQCKERSEGSVRIELTDLSGKRVATGKADVNGLCVLNTARLSASVYILRVFEDGRLAFTRKLMKP